MQPPSCATHSNLHSGTGREAQCGSYAYYIYEIKVVSYSVCYRRKRQVVSIHNDNLYGSMIKIDPKKAVFDFLYLVC